MEKLLLLLLIPFVSFGQGLDFDDIKQINSEKQFKRVMFENGYAQITKGEYLLTYAYGYNASNEEASVWAYFYPKTGKMEFRISKNYDNTPNAVYKRIFEQVKKECTFWDFYDYLGNEYACYTCPNSKYKGKIGIAIGKYGSDYIETFNFE